ncbi:uncharacterized protein LOC111079982 isoform X2 [Drosophila obscura]|uniref:uncharacterized protein LOC111079982 isoform X2 n=1 Tax=Drosophila obscura TaxID=7282 RepID=UPI001BB21C5D|nr:uncharacterized protein LOC111079982 isoform X2 [Drosophila obscura]
MKSCQHCAAPRVSIRYENMLEGIAKMSCWYLEHLSTQERVVLPNGKITIGRHSACRIVLKYAFMSREHVEMSVNPNAVLVRCLNAPNGVFVNNAEIKKELDCVPVREGDVISLGCPLPEEKCSKTWAVFSLKKIPVQTEEIVLSSDSDDDSLLLAPLKAAVQCKVEPDLNISEQIPNTANDNASRKENDEESPATSTASSHPILHLPKVPQVKPEWVQTAKDITNIFGEADEAIIGSVLDINPYLYNHLSKDKEAVPISKLHDGQVIELDENEDNIRPEDPPCPQTDNAAGSMLPPCPPPPLLGETVEDYDETMAMSQAVLQEMKDEMAFSDGEENFFESNNEGSYRGSSLSPSNDDDDIIVITDSDDDDLCSKVTDWSNKLLSQKAPDALSQAYPMADSDAEVDFQSQMIFRSRPEALRILDSSDEESDQPAPRLFPKYSKPLRIDSSSDESDSCTHNIPDKASSKPSPSRSKSVGSELSSTVDDGQLFTRRQRKDPQDIFEGPQFSPEDSEDDDWDFDSVIFEALKDESSHNEENDNSVEKTNDKSVRDVSKKSKNVEGPEQIDLDISTEIELLANPIESPSMGAAKQTEEADASADKLNETPSPKKANVEPVVASKDTKQSRISRRRSTIAVSCEDLAVTSVEKPNETPSVEKTKDKVQPTVSKNHSKAKVSSIEKDSPAKPKEAPSMEKAKAEQPAVSNRKSRIAHRRSTVSVSREELAATSGEKPKKVPLVDKAKDKVEPSASNKNHSKAKESSVKKDVPSKPKEVEKTKAASKDTNKCRISLRRSTIAVSHEEFADACGEKPKEPSSVEKAKDKAQPAVSKKDQAKAKGSSTEKDSPSKRKDPPKVEPEVASKKSRITKRRSTVAVSREEFADACAKEPKETPLADKGKVEPAVSNKDQPKAKSSSIEKESPSKRKDAPEVANKKSRISQRRSTVAVSREQFADACAKEQKETPLADKCKVEQAPKENEPPAKPKKESPSKREPSARLRSRATSCYYERPKAEPDLPTSIVNAMDMKQMRGPEVIEAPSLPKYRGKLRGVSAEPKAKVLDRQRFLDYQAEMNARWKEKPKAKKTVDAEAKDKRREALKKLSEKKPAEDEQPASSKRKATTSVPKVGNSNRGAFLTEGINGLPPSKMPKMDPLKPLKNRRATIDFETFSQQIQAPDLMPRRAPGRPPERKEAECARNQRTCNRVTFASMEKDMEEKLRFQKMSKRVRFNDKVQIKYIESRHAADGHRRMHPVQGKKDTELLFFSTYAERRERWSSIQMNDKTSYFETILKWANQWLKLRSVDAVADLDVLKPIAPEFENFKHYKEIFVPLMKMELLSTIERDYKLGRESYEVCLQHPVDENKSFYCLSTRVFSKPPVKYMLYTLSSGDKLKETFANLREQRTKNGHELIFEILKDGISLETFKGIKLLTARPVVDSLRVDLGALRAVDQLSRSPLYRRIIKPTEMLRNARIPNYGTPFVFKGFAKLNPHQEVICSSTYQRVIDNVPSITLIQGPPGTGKSMIIANISFQCLYGKAALKMDRKILICAHSNTAVDSIMGRLHQVRENFCETDRFQMLRYGLYDKMSPLSRRYSLEHNYERAKNQKRKRVSDDNRVILKQRHNELEAEVNEMKKKNLNGTWLFDKYQEKVKQLQIYEEQLNPRLTQREEFNIAESHIKGANIVCTTLSSCVKLSSYINYFDICLIDEATQCTEPWTLLPMRFGIPHLVLVGDTQQLPAIVLSQKAVDFGLAKSMFDRIQRSLEKQQADQPHAHLSVHTKLFKLTTQYRMHPEICKWPNRYFYEDQLVNQEGLERLLATPILPYAVINLGFTRDSCDPKTRSISNEEEARFVTKLLTEMDKHLPSKRYGYGLISPYSSQCYALSQMLPTHMRLLPPLTVDAYQGMESDVVVISNARTRGSGFLANYQRLNVAVTRPRRCLIICGNFNDLQNVGMWGDLLDDARKRGIYFDLKREDVANLSESLISKLLVKPQVNGA